jgi:3-hydroxy acid dehydrogenase/malonic semialdehyde reductase
MGKHVVITGASAGIGAATARLLAEKGYYVTLIARRVEKLEALQKELSGSVSMMALDITEKEAVQRSFEQIEKNRPIDVLINNAGAAFGIDKAQDASLDDWDKCIDLNIKGLLYCTHCVLPSMIKRRSGHIINLGSIAGTYAYPGGNVYGSTKAFLHQLSINLRADLFGTPVRVSCIEPGLTGGTEFSQVRFKGDLQRVNKLYNNANPLTPEDIAETIFFCINAPDHVNINSIELMPVSQSFGPLLVHYSE